jgi:hypothetical protein
MFLSVPVKEPKQQLDFEKMRKNEQSRDIWR